MALGPDLGVEQGLEVLVEGQVRGGPAAEVGARGHGRVPANDADRHAPAEAFVDLSGEVFGQAVGSESSGPEGSGSGGGAGHEKHRLKRSADLRQLSHSGANRATALLLLPHLGEALGATDGHAE